MRRFENMKEALGPVERQDSGGVAGGDSGEVGLRCVGWGNGVRTQVVEDVTGLDGGFLGIRWELALPFDVLVVLDSRLGLCGCGLLSSFLD